MDEELILATKIILSVFLGGLVVLLLHLYDSLLVKPKKLRSRLQEQGINGHSPSFLLGNIPDMKRIKLKVQAAPKENHNNVVPIAHDCPSTNFPYFDQWRKEYGPMFLFSFGSIQQLCLTDTEIVKEISLCTSLSLGKPPYLVKDRGALVGQGIGSSSGPIWAHQRKIIAPEFYIDKVKLAMVIQETLRLYPALLVVTRAALQDIKFKDTLIPKGMNIWVPVAMLQQHPDIWGPDAHEFNPERFSQGVTGACKIPQAFIPFGLGARICVGQHFAMTQLKLILSLTLSKFCLSLSPTYQHSPAYGVLLEPQHGIPLHVRRV